MMPSVEQAIAMAVPEARSGLNKPTRYNCLLFIFTVGALRPVFGKLRFNLKNWRRNSRTGEAQGLAGKFLE
ncbi:MAG: hypothetical protein PHP91_04775 [Pseudodesulfovibrio sp.]|nr:hypothetical protein [Pseudodesulfovibrio sp.]